MNNSNPKIAAIIVSYYPNMDTLYKLLGSINAQVANIILVDNCSLSDSQLKSLPIEIIVKSLPENMGLGRAQNEGIFIAQQLNANFVLILDQDSIPAPNMVSNLLNGYICAQISSPVAAVGANYGGLYSPFVRLSWLSLVRVECLFNQIVEVDHLISSGCLISLEAIYTIGLMKEDFFIDHVDTEWSIRAKSKGYTIWGIRDATMEHRLGEEMVNILGREIPLHKPFRYYYIIRNGVSLAFSKAIPFQWRVVMLIRTLKIAVLFSIFPKNRFANLKMILIGFKDSAIGIRGKFKN